MRATLADAATDTDKCQELPVGAHDRALDTWANHGVPLHRTTVGHLLSIALRYRHAYGELADILIDPAWDMAERVDRGRRQLELDTA